MKKKYGDKLTLTISTVQSEEAKPYQFRSATNVLLDEELLPLDVAIDANKMDTFLSKKI